MALKSRYVIDLVRRGREIVFPEAVITALKEFKRNHKYSMLPGDMQAREEAMRQMLAVFCTALNIQPVEMRSFDLSLTGNSAPSYYDSIERCITMIGKLSVITFLHEFAHALNPEGGEDFARMWSLTLFRKVYPKSFERLYMRSADPAEFYMLNPPDPAAAFRESLARLDAAMVGASAVPAEVLSGGNALNALSDNAPAPAVAPVPVPVLHTSAREGKEDN